MRHESVHACFIHSGASIFLSAGKHRQKQGREQASEGAGYPCGCIHQASVLLLTARVGELIEDCVVIVSLSRQKCGRRSIFYSSYRAPFCNMFR